MFLRKKFFIGTLVFVLFGMATAQASVDEQIYTLAMPTNEPGWVGAFVDDSVAFRFSSFVVANSNEGIRDGRGYPCLDFKSDSCKAQPRVTFNLFLPPCSPAIQVNCISEFAAITKDGREIAGKFKSYSPALSEPTFKGDPSKKFPDGWFPSLWNFDGINHPGGSDFLLRASLLSFQAFTDDPMKFAQLRVAVNAVNFQSHPSRGTWRPVDVNQSLENGIMSAGGAEAPDCKFFLAVNECASAWPLPNDVRFRITVKTQAKLSGWINGRILNPSITSSVDNDGNSIYSIEAGSLQVPVYAVWKKHSELSKDFRDFLYQAGGQAGTITYPLLWRSVYSGSGPEPFDKISANHTLNIYNEANFQEFLYFIKEAGDKSIATKSMWHFETNQNYDTQENFEVRRCSEQKVGISGVVSTNSTMFLANPPKFNLQTQSLDYKVAAPHLDKNGNMNRGTYDLIIDSQVARCLYGFNSAPVNASVSVINTEGVEQVATTTVKEKDGWLHLAANGYTYSSPTLRVKLSQDVPSKPVETQNSQATVTAPVTQEASKATTKVKKVSVKKSISCVKGKVTQKITGTNPKCPVGYKKK